jgi:glycosyltransferase involved in cell wall biosynthesis
MLAVIETHPVQYHAPVYRSVQQELDVSVTAIYGSDFSAAGYTDREFGTKLVWDTDLLGGYDSRFLSRVEHGGAKSDSEVTTRGLRQALAEVPRKAILLLGYSPRFHRNAFFEARRCGVPLLFRGETTDHARARSAGKAWLRDRALQWLYSQCARLLFVGQRSRDHYRRLGVAENKLVFSPYCVDESPFRTAEVDRMRLREPTRAELGLAAGDRAVLFSGKLSARKGPDLLVNAVKSMPATLREKIALLFLGDGELKSSLAALARGEPAVRAHFLGFHNQTRLSRFFHAAELLVLPSVFSETWGLVVNEALHHGLPVVVSEAVGSAPDLVSQDQTGVVCETGSLPSLALALERGLKLTHRPDIREACRRRIGGYSVRRAAEGIAQAYREAIEVPGE